LFEFALRALSLGASFSFFLFIYIGVPFRTSAHGSLSYLGGIVGDPFFGDGEQVGIAPCLTVPAFVSAPTRY
jgi:hypothetical protein